MREMPDGGWAHWHCECCGKFLPGLDMGSAMWPQTDAGFFTADAAERALDGAPDFALALMGAGAIAVEIGVLGLEVDGRHVLCPGCFLVWRDVSARDRALDIAECQQRALNTIGLNASKKGD